MLNLHNLLIDDLLGLEQNKCNRTYSEYEAKGFKTLWKYIVLEVSIVSCIL